MTTPSDAVPATLTDMCEQYLRNRHCVLWGAAYEVLTEAGRQAAAEWFASQIDQLLAETGMRLVPKQTASNGPINIQFTSPPGNLSVLAQESYDLGRRHGRDGR